MIASAVWEPGTADTSDLHSRTNPAGFARSFSAEFAFGGSQERTGFYFLGVSPMKEFPFYKWFPNDYAGDPLVRAMTPLQDLTYRRLLDISWDRGSLPKDKTTLDPRGIR